MQTTAVILNLNWISKVAIIMNVDLELNDNVIKQRS